MNPLDLGGPEFLQFYLLAGVVGLGLAALLRARLLRSFEASGARRWSPGYHPRGEEAYAVAVLRGGRLEAVHALLARLVTGGLASLDDRTIRRSSAVAGTFGLAPIEREALAALGDGVDATAAGVQVTSAVAPRLTAIEQDLERQGLLLGPDQRRRVWTLAWLAAGTLAGLGLAKLVVALGRGRTNVGFLLILIVVYLAVALFVLRPPRLSPAGRRYLDWLRESHRSLVSTLARGPHDQPGEAALAAGIFGLAAVPAFVGLQGSLRPRQQDGGSGWESSVFTSSDAGSSDTSSSGGGGDSGGDGGGGDSGGGGGCGGCGGGGGD